MAQSEFVDCAPKQYELIREDDFMIIARPTHHEIITGELYEGDFPGWSMARSLNRSLKITYRSPNGLRISPSGDAFQPTARTWLPWISLRSSETSVYTIWRARLSRRSSTWGLYEHTFLRKGYHAFWHALFLCVLDQTYEYKLRVSLLVFLPAAWITACECVGSGATTAKALFVCVY